MAAKWAEKEDVGMHRLADSITSWLLKADETRSQLHGPTHSTHSPLKTASSPAAKHPAPQTPQ